MTDLNKQIGDDLMMAAINCGHAISEDEITLSRDQAKPGNSLHQLRDRVLAAHLAARQPLADRFVAPGVTVDTPKFCDLLSAWDRAEGGEDAKVAADVLIAHIDAHTARAVAAAVAPLKRTNLELTRVNAEQRLQEQRLDVALQRALPPVAGELPPLPETRYNGCGDGSEPLYTLDMMQAYVLADRAQRTALPVQQPAAVVGWKLVPDKLTALMRYAMSGECATHMGKLDEMYEAAWRAAPVPAAGVQGDHPPRVTVEMVQAQLDTALQIIKAMEGRHEIELKLAGLPDSGRDAALDAEQEREFLRLFYIAALAYANNRHSQGARLKELIAHVNAAISAYPAPSSDAALLTALKDIAEACNCCGDRADLAQIAQDALDAHPANGAQAGCGKCPKQTAYGPATCGECLEGGAQAGDAKLLEQAAQACDQQADGTNGPYRSGCLACANAVRKLRNSAATPTPPTTEEA